ncbi:MAG: DUF3368 domain-containing protein [Bacteroidia bacterium]
MIIISDTSVMINLAQIGHLSLLPQIFPEIIIPEAVFKEITHGDKPLPGATEIVEADWLSVASPIDDNLILSLLDEIDLGEAEAIVLAIERKADFLLIDERRGRSVARRYKLDHLGILGILLQAKTLGLISQVKPLLDRLINEARFYIGAKQRSLNNCPIWLAFLG